jgi:hypothetical protein
MTKATVSCVQGERFAGQWYNGKKHGYGRYVFENGDMYDGDWKNDMAHGKGYYRCAVLLSTEAATCCSCC